MSVLMKPRGLTIFLRSLWRDFDGAFQAILPVIERRLEVLREQTNFTFRKRLMQRVERQNECLEVLLNDASSHHTQSWVCPICQINGGTPTVTHAVDSLSQVYASHQSKPAMNYNRMEARKFVRSVAGCSRLKSSGSLLKQIRACSGFTDPQDVVNQY